MIVLFLAMATFAEGARVKKREKMATVSETAKKEVASLSQKAEEKAGTTSSTLDKTVSKKGGTACMKMDFTLTLYGQAHAFALPASTGIHSESCSVFKDKNGLGLGDVKFECKDEKWAYVSNTCQSSNGPVCRRTRFTVTGMDGKGVTLQLEESQPGFVEASCAEGSTPGLTGTVHFLCGASGAWEHKSGFCRMQMFDRMMTDGMMPDETGSVHAVPDEDVQMMPHPDPVSFSQRTEEKATTSSNLDKTVHWKGGAACMESDFTLTLYGQAHEFALPTGTGAHSESCAAFKDKNGLGLGEVKFECKDEKWAYVSNTCQSSKGPVCRQTRFTITGMNGKDVALSLKESQPGFVEASCAEGSSPGLTGTVHFLCSSLGVWEHKSGFCRMQMFDRMMHDAAGSGPVHAMPDDVQMMPHPDPVSFSQRSEKKAGSTSSNLDGTAKNKVITFEDLKRMVGL